MQYDRWTHDKICMQCLQIFRFANRHNELAACNVADGQTMRLLHAMLQSCRWWTQYDCCVQCCRCWTHDETVVMLQTVDI